MNVMRTLPRLDFTKLTPRQSNSYIEPDFLGYTARSWIELTEREGPVFKVDLHGEEFVVVCSHEADLAAWRSPESWTYGPPATGGVFFADEMGELHVTQLDGEPHRRARKLILPAFGISSVTRDLPVVAKTIHEGLASLTGREVSLHEALMVLFTRALSRSQVKKDLSEDELRDLAAYEEAFIPAGSLTVEDRRKWTQRPRYVQLKESAFRIFQEIVTERLSGRRKNDSFDFILDREVPENFAPLNEEELVRAAYLLLVAGVGNISNLLCATLWGLERHPEWTERLRAELDGFEPAQLKSGVKHLPVLKAVVSEGERCYLPAPVIPKMSAEDIELLGYRIPAGTNILHLHGLAHFEPGRYAEPFRFDPERWLSDDLERPNAFGGGTHLCLGMGVTRLYMPLTLATWVKHYDWQAEGPPEMVPQDPDVDYSPKTTRFMVRLSEISG